MEGIVTAFITGLAAVLVAYITYGMNGKKQSDNHDEVMEAIQELKSSDEGTKRLALANARNNIAMIYNEHKEVKKIDNLLLQDAEDLYDAYKAVKINGKTPNSWCDKVMDEMREWEEI